MDREFLVVMTSVEEYLHSQILILMKCAASCGRPSRVLNCVGVEYDYEKLQRT